MNLSRPVAALLTAALLASGATVALAPPAAAAEEIYPAPASGAWTVDGRAWGHGRGMSQWGSQGAALQGVSASEILSFYYPGTEATSIGNPLVKASLTRFTPTTTVTLWTPDGRDARVGPLGNENVYGPGRWTVTISGGTVKAERRAMSGGPVLDTVTTTDVMRFGSGSYYGVVVAGSSTAETGRWYRGDLRIEPTGPGGFNVTNSVHMEDYLRSVVPRESPASWEPAALQAQSVAARSYAWHKVTHGNALCDTTACQVYYGRGDTDRAGNLTQSWEHERTDAAIGATAGQIRTYNGSVAFTEFSSSNGGWTTASSVPYQVAKYDPWSGTAPGDNKTRWTTSLTVARVGQNCPSGGTLRNLVILGRNGNGELGGRITAARLECTTGNVTINNPAFGMLSSWWKPRSTSPRLESPTVSKTIVDHAASMSISVTPNVGVDWTLKVTDRSTGRTAQTTTGSALAGVRFKAVWDGTWGPRATGDPAHVGPGVYDLTLSAVDAVGTPTLPVRATVTVRRPADPAVVASVPLVGESGYVPVTPTRLFDSRENFQSLGAGQRADLTVVGKAGVPAAGVTAVVLNVTEVAATTDTHLRIWPAGLPRPTASSLNTDASRTQAGMVTVAVGGEGKVSLYNAAGTAHYIVDVLGYYTTDLASSSRYTPIDPTRVLDSRSGAALTDWATREIDVAAALGVPRDSLSAVAVNVTAAGTKGVGYVVAYGGGSPPSTSTVNLAPGSDVANRAVTPVVDGKISVRLRGGPSHVIVDVVGWYGTPGAATGSTFTPIQPSRLLDTRSGTAFGPGESRSLVVRGGVVPTGATAIVGTLTATGQTSVVTHARIWPAGLPLTPTSDLNSGRGRTQANAVIVRIGTGGAVRLYNDLGQSHLILDVVGYFR